MHSNSYNFPNEPKAKRKQVKIACSSCKASCKKCDEARPCTRCVTRGIGDSCQDSERKMRVKGTRRGPYRKANKKRLCFDPHPFRLPSIKSLLGSIDFAAPSPTYTSSTSPQNHGYYPKPPAHQQTYAVRQALPPIREAFRSFM